MTHVLLNPDAVASASSATMDKLFKEIEAVRRDSHEAMLAAMTTNSTTDVTPFGHMN